MVTVVTLAGGCGGHEKAPQATSAERPKADTPYVEALLGFSDAAKSNAAYDAYGYAEYIPDSQRAAIDAFCLVASKVRTGAEIGKLADPDYFFSRIVATARPERRNASMASIRRAVGKLQSVVEPQSLDGALVKSYAKACY